MDEMQRLYGGQIYSDNFEELGHTLKSGALIDSSMNGVVMFMFLLNWTPNWFRSCILNPIMSLFTKTKFYRKDICYQFYLVLLGTKAVYHIYVGNY